MRPMFAMVIVFALVSGAVARGAESADLKPIHVQKTKDAVVTLKRWTPGKNSFVLEIASPSGQPLDAGRVAVSTSMTMPGMAPMITGATLSPDKAPGRYMGTIDFPDGGTRQVTVTWDGPAGKGSTKFSIPVR